MSKVAFRRQSENQWQSLILGGIGIHLCIMAVIEILGIVGLVATTEDPTSNSILWRRSVLAAARLGFGLVLLLSQHGVKRLWDLARNAGRRKHSLADAKLDDEEKTRGRWPMRRPE